MSQQPPNWRDRITRTEVPTRESPDARPTDMGRDRRQQRHITTNQEAVVNRTSTMQALLTDELGLLQTPGVRTPSSWFAERLLRFALVVLKHRRTILLYEAVSLVGTGIAQVLNYSYFADPLRGDIYMIVTWINWVAAVVLALFVFAVFERYGDRQLPPAS